MAFDDPLPKPEDPGGIPPEDPGTPEPTPPANTTPAPVDPWATAPADGNWEAWFLRNVQGLTPNPETLAGLESKLAAHKIKVLRNAQGIAGKIQLPDGTIVDVGRAFSSGDPSKMGWAWQVGESDGSTSNMPDADWFAANMPPPDPYTTLERPGHLQQPFDAPQFDAPTLNDLEGDAGYQARLTAAQRGLERSAAAKGSILSGGFLGRTMPRELQQLASDEYSNLYKRRLDAFTTNSGLSFGARQMNESAYQDDVSNMMNQYGQRYRTWRDLIGDQFRLGEMGMGATAAGAPK